MALPLCMKCSVIVAFYNSADVILQALRSVEQQTYTNWEVVLVNDGSLDNSLAVVESYLTTVPDKAKYSIITLPENMGVGYAKRTGVSKSSGDVVFILDADDALAPTALQELVLLHQKHPKASIVYSTHYNCDENLNPIQVETDVKQVKANNILEDSISHLVSFKLELYNQTEGIDPYFKLAVDKDLYLKLEEAGDVVFLKKPLYYYRISDKGISRGFSNYVRSRDYRLVAIHNALQRRRKSGLKLPQKSDLDKLMAEIHLLQAESLLYSEQTLGIKFLKHLYLSVRYKPLSSISRKLKAAFLLSRLKRYLVS